MRWSNAAPFIESGESLRVTPEAVCLGICWEWAYWCFHKDMNHLCQKGGICFLAQTQMCPNPILSLLVVGAYRVQLLLRYHFSNILLIQEVACLGGARGIKADIMQMNESVSGE